MKIIIVGAGQVGTHLAKMLSRENHDIILIDEDESRLQNLESNYDLITVVGAPTSIQDQKEAGVKDADLFIAVTPIESQNITACVVATNLGAKKTVARIDNYEYLKPENKQFFEKLGVNALIYPELLASEEIINSLKVNWVRQWMEFNSGALTLIGMKVRSNAPILNKRLMDLKDSENFRVVAIRRNLNTIIPTGHDEIKCNDIVYFITTKHYVTQVREQAGKTVINVKDLMIMGGGRIAVRTVQNLPQGMNVKVFEKNRSKTTKLVEQMDDAMVILGDATNLEMMKEEGIENTDAFVALTDNSEANILACMAAKRFGIQKTVAEIENMDYIPLAESLDIGTVINKKILAASYIYQYTLDVDVNKVKCLTHVDAEVVELTARENSKITKGCVKDLSLPADMFIGGVVRNGEGFIVKGDFEIKANDHVIVFCLSSSIRKLDKLFN